MERVLIAGATGYLGSFILKELMQKNYTVTALARNPQKLSSITSPSLKIIKAEITRPETLLNCCKDIDVVISTVGITRQKDGFTYMDVDYQGNLNLLKEAQKSGVKKFIYVSVFNGDKLTRLKICKAKEAFVSELKQSGIDYTIIRPTGFFSDMSEFFKMAEKGKIYLFGKGEHKINPIDGRDLAIVCVEAIKNNKKEINVGGPQILTHEQIAQTAFSVAGNKERIICFPVWLKAAALFLLRTFTGSKMYGPIEFFLTVMTTNFVAPTYGAHTLRKFFEELKEKHGNNSV